MFALALLSLNLLSNPLATYISKPQPAFAWTVESRAKNRLDLKLTSQTWQGATWKHDLIEIMPKRAAARDTVLLVVTGDRVDRADIPFAQRLAEASHMPVWTLFEIPNQPIFDQREDDLIAYSFQKYMETGDETWPLVLPMTNSVIKAMDAIQAATHGQVHRFVITGASKRGWTTWLAGATGDKRICAIAPVAFDFLNMPAQLNHQAKTWGKLSEMLQSYTDKDLQDQAATEEGKKLLAIIDPYNYLDRIDVPVLSIRGTNDRFWALDATSIYASKVKKLSLLYLPNEGHDFEDETEYIRTLTAFAMAQAGVFRWPSPKAARAKVMSFSMWSAFSSNQDFRDREWKQHPFTENSQDVRPRPSLPTEAERKAAQKARFSAFFLDRKFHFRTREGTVEFWLSGQVSVSPLGEM